MKRCPLLEFHCGRGVDVLSSQPLVTHWSFSCLGPKNCCYGWRQVGHPNSPAQMHTRTFNLSSGGRINVITDAEMLTRKEWKCQWSAASSVSSGREGTNRRPQRPWFMSGQRPLAECHSPPLALFLSTFPVYCSCFIVDTYDCHQQGEKEV